MMVLSATRTFSTSSRTALACSPGELLRATARRFATAEYFANSVVGHGGCAQLFEQLCRVGQRVAENPDHGFFDLPGGEPQAFLIRSCLGDQDGGDVVAIASGFLDGVRWGEPRPLGIDQQARQQLGSAAFPLR
jgi:hypothetical protein